VTGRRIAKTSVAVSALLCCFLVGTGTLVRGVPAGADTDPTTLSGQGGSFVEPMMSKLIDDDAANLNPLFAAYQLTDDVSGISSFVGTGTDQFSADFAVTQRPLTSAESAQAKADGRSYAYIPFAATPVAITTLVPTYTWANGNALSITPAGFCQNIPLTAVQLGELFGDELTTAPPLPNWQDTSIDCPGGGGPGGDSAGSYPVAPQANLDPSMSNYALMALLDSNSAAKAYLDAAIAGANSLVSTDTPSELWPFAGDTTPGGDQPFIGKLLAINARTNAPSTTATQWSLGGIAPISSVWTGSPLGVAWNLPTAAVQNAANSFVAPTLAAAQAAQADATMAATSDPTTDNLVTFNVNNSADTAAYNSYLMEESYLVVPLNGLSAAKATGLAQLVRFMLGTQGQADIESFGSAPATAAMQAAGLQVAAELNAEGASATSASGGSSTTATTTAGGSSTTSTGTGAASAATGSAATSSSGSSDGSSSGGLAFTGASHLGAWVALGAAMMVSGALIRRRLKRREVRQ
jgi:ABC-type phosphate transport system substrate-binding protein